MITHFRFLVPALLSSSLLLMPAVPAAADDFDTAEAAFKQASKSASFSIRMQASARLAATQDHRAIELLGRQYASPRKPKAQGRHAVAGLLGRYFSHAQHTGALARLRKKHAAPTDAWLWYRTLVIHGAHAGTGELWAVARDDKVPAQLRAAAIEAAVTLGEGGVGELGPDVFAALPADPADRAVLVQSLATALLRARENIDEGALTKSIDALVAYLTTDQASEATRVVAARVLQQLLESRFGYLDGKAWSEHRVRPGATRASDARRLAKVECAGKRGEGARIAYVIDVSERASKPVSEDERERLLDTKNPVPSRLALMREAVRESIRALKPEQSFIVLHYAHRAVGVLPGLGRFMPATYDNKTKAFEGLNQLAADGAPDLHAGLMSAYQAHTDGVVASDEHLAPETILGGCDTVFLFSHANARLDQWVAKDPARRTESARTLATGSGVWGIYADPRWLADELARWRMFRKAKVHGIAFGDADRQRMQAIEAWTDAFSPRGVGGRAAAARAPEPDAKYVEALAKYKDYRKRASWNKRTKGRSLLASTRSLHAIDELARDYGAAEKPVPVVQQTIVDIVAERFRERNCLPAFARWRGRFAQREDSWLWHRGLQLVREHDDHATTTRTATEAHDPFLRAAGIRAAAKAMGEELLTKIPSWVEDIRAAKATGVDRILPIEAMATALETLGSSKDEEAYKTAALALLDVFDDESTPKRTKLTIVRNLAAGLEVPPDGLQKNAWVREVRAGGSGVGMADSKYGAPTFGGLRASGTRICYVIDMSDSMLTPLAPHERIKSRVVTGAVARKRRRPEDEIDWSKLKTRFDLARALLVTSLQSLQPGTHFCVIWFGSEAGTLSSTKGLVATTPASVSRTVKELRKIKAGAAGSGKHKTGVKFGSLRGETNLHGGLTQAFTRTEGKPLTGFTYVSEPGLEQGCDTIFVLSDGAPSTDDYVQLDKAEPEDRAVEDRETMKRAKAMPEMNYPGPYSGVVTKRHLFHDIERRNLFRQVEIHCLGIGEANMGTLGTLSRLGLGESRKIGDDE